MPKSPKLSRTQIIEIHKFMETCINKLDNGMCEYTGNESDHRLATKFKVSTSTVLKLRQELFGKLRLAVTGGNVMLENKITALENVVKGLTATVNELTDKHNKMAAQLTINRITDVKHLKVNGSAVQPSLQLLPQGQG